MSAKPFHNSKSFGMRWVVRSVLALLLLAGASATPALAQDQHGAPPAAGHPAQQPGEHPAQDPHAQAPTKSTLEMDNGDFFRKQFSHSVPYILFTPSLSPDKKVNEAFGSTTSSRGSGSRSA